MISNTSILSYRILVFSIAVFYTVYIFIYQIGHNLEDLRAILLCGGFNYYYSAGFSQGFCELKFLAKKAV